MIGHRRLQGLLMSVLLLQQTNLIGQELQFNSYRDAMSAGAGLYRSGNLAASKPAFEAAIELATSERERTDAYIPLIKVFAEGGDFPRMFESAEYVVDHAAYEAQASLTIRALIGIAQQKNQLQALRTRYEDRAAKQPTDRTALTILAAFHNTVTRDFGKQAEYLLRLVDLDKDEQREPNPELMFNLAFAYKLSRDNQQAAALFERTALLSKDLESSSLMEAAEAWQRDGQSEKALAAAQQAHDIGPDKRAKNSAYRWHRTLGEVFLAEKKKEQAILQLTAAHENASIDTYKQQCLELIEQANAL